MNYNKIFDVDFRKLSMLLTPIFWRKVTFINWLYCLAEPFVVLLSDFGKFRAKSIYKIVHNGQVSILEKVLNDAFDVEQRRIYIIDSPITDSIYVYSIPEAKPVYLDTQYVYDFNAFEDIEFDFFVVMPLELKPFSDFDITNFENQIKGLVNYYKLASKRYKILWIA